MQKLGTLFRDKYVILHYISHPIDSVTLFFFLHYIEHGKLTSMSAVRKECS
jgi:hypothetical protein